MKEDRNLNTGTQNTGASGQQHLKSIECRKLLIVSPECIVMIRVMIVLLSLSLLSMAGMSSHDDRSEGTSKETGETAAQRLRMVREQIEERGVRDRRVLEAMKKIPRHLFVSESLRGRAYGDHPLPIGEGQTISQPYVVAWMTEALNLKASDRVLEIGTGSGYQAAVLAEIAREVYSIEIRQRLKDRAAELLSLLGYTNITTKYGDGYYGWEEHAPFDAIMITASANHIPPPLLKQLKTGGRLIIPLGSTLYYQTLTLVEKTEGAPEVMQMGSVAFVPMTGQAQEK